MAWGTITSPHSTTSSQFGGDMGNKLAKLFSAVDISQSPYDATDIPKINTPFDFYSGRIQIFNPTQSFVYKIIASAIAANRNVTLPLMLYDSSFAILGVDQSFTEAQEIMVDASNILELTRPINTVSTAWGVDFWAKDSLNNFQQYGAIQLVIQDNTNNSEDSDLILRNIVGGTLKTGLRVGASGVAIGSNVRALLKDNLLTASRNINFQDADQIVAAIDIGNSFTAAQTVNFSTSGPLLTLYRPTNTVTNGSRLNFDLRDSANAQKTYGQILAAIDVNTAGSEVGHFEVWNMISGTLTKVLTFDTSGKLDLLRGLFIEGVISPSQITSNQNDYNPTNLASNMTVRLNADLHGRKITGLANSADEGDIKILMNVGTKDIILTDQDTGSTTAGDRFLFGEAVILHPDEVFPIIYDLTTARWRPLTTTRRRAVGDYRQRPSMFTDCMRESAGCLNPFEPIAISSGTLTGIASNAEHPGVIRFISSTTANSGYQLRTSTTGQIVGGGEVFEAVVQFPGFTNNTVRIGLHDTTTSADAVDGVYFEMAASSAVNGKTSSNSVRSTTASAFTASTATWYRLKIIISATNRVDFYVYDDAGAQLYTDSLTANLPTSAGREWAVSCVATNSTTTGSINILDLDYMGFFPGEEASLVR